MSISRRTLLAGTGAVTAGGVLASLTPSAARAGGHRAGHPGAVPLNSRNSVFSRQGAGPLYWSIYGWSYPHDAPIPEDEWQANIDWLAEDFAPHGYTMACTDGWIEWSTKTNENGYVVSYNDDWEHGWAYWADYLHSKGMKLGVYYMPLWVHKAAVEAGDRTVVGTDIPLQDIVTEGDMFYGRDDTGEVLYWADVEKPGTKEFVQGYVDHFRNMGVDYLRVDFLSWYETGTDAGMGDVGQAHGRENYLTFLEWMDEAAGDEMMLSLVMPHLFEHGRGELAHGDMIRINSDAFEGGWEALSGGRQEWQESWSQWHNPFLGFTGFADRSGRGQLVLDGDFLMAGTFDGDDERRTMINLMTIAGSPLTISDLHDNIGDHGWVFTNPEVLELNSQGLAGKPYFHSATPFSEDPESRDPERWAGQLPNGDWAVALFNREDSTATRSIDFAADLGFEGEAAVRDLWEHEDLGPAAHLEVELAPHASRLVRLTPQGPPQRFHAAFAAWGGGAVFGNTIDGHTGMGYAAIDAVGASVTFGVQAEQAGTYGIEYTYAAEADATLTVSSEEISRKVVGQPHQVEFPATGGEWRTVGGTIELAEGVTIVTVIRRGSPDSGEIALNHIDIELH